MQVVEHEEPLLAISRLDHCTEGLLFLAKTPAFASFYNRLLQASLPDGSPSIRKHYKALTKTPPQAGKLCFFRRILVSYQKLNQRYAPVEEITVQLMP